MLRLNKKTEYGLLALRHISRLAPGTRASTHVIAVKYNIPEMVLAKVLQQLKRANIVTSSKGAGGGYALQRPLHEVPLLVMLNLFRVQTSLVECLETGTHQTCKQGPQCDIKGPIAILDRALVEPLRRLSIGDLFHPEASEFKSTASLSISSAAASKKTTAAP